MRHRDDHDPSSVSLSRPSLPRLRNRASLGRLNAYGGVLDFEVTSSKGKGYDFNMTSRSDSSKSTFSLAGPAATTTTFSPDYNTTMHQSTSSKQEHREESYSNMHTPKKNTTQATLRALKMLDREEINNKNIKQATTPSSSTSNVIPFIPVLDSDHPQAQSQTGHGQGHGQGHGRGAHQIHSHSRQVSTTPSRPTLDLDVDVDVDAVVEGSGTCAPTSRSAALEKTGRARRGAGAEKDEERLVREIREDMDEGGYASLEQVRSLTLRSIISLLPVNRLNPSIDTQNRY